MHHHLPNDIPAALDDLSAPRLLSYRAFFNNPSDPELYGVYCWNDAISMRLMRLIGNIEIILRNRLHRELSRFAYMPGVSTGDKDANDWYRFVITPGTKAAQLIGKQTTGGLLVSTTPCHHVVAQMTYGFWPRLLQIKQNRANVVIPWDTMIPSIFPDHTKKASTYWTSQHEQDKLFVRLDLIGDLRNRVAHFEPVWKFGELKDEWIKRTNHPVTVVAPPPASPAQAIARLRLVYARTTQLLSWLSKSRAGDYMVSENHLNLDWLLSQEGFDHFRNIGNVETVRLSSLTKSWGTKLALQGRKSVLVEHKQQLIGRYFSLQSKP
ncbi:hypothetical protein [Rugamonas rubra]|jgi:hypothetical protein|uniref:Abi-like protein n=1 Tax=Rugamonas rubra TaxID=758825 RepID=A0A1I4PX54_9BURK|nr:hypothetical protein [Rugamonas rubra]SFM32402.1 hypothetical protein SAMN02982985_03675 [Rugamonas rubra]